jgi:hypothetical protein
MVWQIMGLDAVSFLPIAVFLQAFFLSFSNSFSDLGDRSVFWPSTFFEIASCRQGYEY